LTEAEPVRLLAVARQRPLLDRATVRGGSDINLTMGIYTDWRLLDLAGAVARLPDLPLDGTDRESARATGTHGRAAASPYACPCCKKSVQIRGYS
jgi:hypothetical protein